MVLLFKVGCLCIRPVVAYVCDLIIITVYLVVADSGEDILTTLIYNPSR